MALYFNLGLIARTRAEADACADFFRARPLTLDGRDVPLEIFVDARPRTSDFLVGVWPRGMSYASPKGDDRRLTEDSARAAIARFFDAALIDAPPFAAAHFGGEAYDYFLDADEPIEVQLAGGFGGLYVDEVSWEAMGKPADAVQVGAQRYAWARRDGASL